MSIVPSISTLTSGYNLSKINANFQNIKTALTDVLSRSGVSPNQMTADIDMNSNDVLNAGLVTANKLTVGGVAISTTSLAVGPQGNNGWSPVFSIITDSARRVLQLTSYVGGQGISPTTYINYYVGATQMEPLIANGVDIRGPTGSGSGDMIKATYDAANINQQLVGTIASQVLTNKSLSDTTTSVVSAGDNTKKLVFDVSSISPATTRTVKWANTSGTPALYSDNPGLLYGCTLSNDGGTPASVLDISSGVCTDSTSVDKLIVPTLTKSIASTWVVGTGNGGLDTGVVTNGSYHVFAIKRPDTGVVDALFSVSATAPTLPANYTLFRRLGSIRYLSGSIEAFIQDGDRFYWNSSSLTPDVTIPNGGVAKAVLSVHIPNLIRVEGIFQIHLQTKVTTTNVKVTLYDGVNNNIAKYIEGQGNYYASVVGGVITQMSNTSKQIYYAADNIGSPTTITTLGWIDTRGRI